MKIGNVELTEEEALNLYQSKKYIVTYSKIYELFYSVPNTCIYGRVIYNNPGMCKRGRYHALSAADVNHLVGKVLVIQN